MNYFTRLGNVKPALEIRSRRGWGRYPVPVQVRPERADFRDSLDY